MTASSRIGLVLIVMSLAAPTLAAPDEKAPRAVEKLPKPLEGLSANLVDLEKTGYFTITKVEFGRSEDLRDEAFVWTVKVVKPITCPHAILLLRRVSDVRFYATNKGSRYELYSTMLCYSSRISAQAENRGRLDLDEEFRLWLPIDAVHLRMLKSERATTVVFAELKP